MKTSIIHNFDQRVQQIKKKLLLKRLLINFDFLLVNITALFILYKRKTKLCVTSTQNVKAVKLRQ